ncbi:DNA replication/repair protein RecF [Permianibacter sp. IMCC34836]|uniref:DNA replication/repair protein RecF n=1 Tax=Permianibacter fluminis TaxID=2738515 RepID=UPI00155577C6|nr:DNA replication/repair protein RecF [Permianibacter fluminis]NQD36020.1 DNA replication/repair protein RecF [Permianibacter fluminis]
MLTELRFQHIRNLTDGALLPAPHLNWVFGGNGAGKTSLLEAIGLLATGRSFRSSQIERVIQDGKAELTVFGRWQSGAQEHRIGVRRDRQSGFELRLDGQSERKLSAVATLMPVQVLTPDSYSLLSASPRERRRFLDWGVFHVEHGYAGIAQRYARLLQQRNALLKAKAGSKELAPWTSQLVEAADILHRLRLHYWQMLAPDVEAAVAGFLPDAGVSFDWYRGWPEGQLAELLETGLERDRINGATGYGPHKADLRVRIGRIAADEKLSRGQCKLVVQALHLAQLRKVAEQNERGGLLLLDDISTELDAARQAELLASVLALPGWQVFVTATQKGPEDLLARYNGAMFHVEHGVVSALQ